VRAGPERDVSDFAVVGLATMGQNLARNLASKRVAVSVYNRTAARTDEFLKEHGKDGAIQAAHSVEDLVGQLSRRAGDPDHGQGGQAGR